MERGQHVIVNVSRNIIRRARENIPDLKIIFVKVPFEITSQRLISRCREPESDPAFRQRLQRAKECPILKDADFVVDNSGSLETAAITLLNYLLSF
jgi:ribose 1,5-bisphosphokinase PhnN